MNALPPQTTLLSLSRSMPQAPDPRDDNRAEPLLRIACLVIDDRREMCLIRNVSAGGALIRTSSKVPVGQSVAIELRPGESVAGIVRWSNGNLVGIMFTQLVDVIQLLADTESWPRPRQPRVEIEGTAWLRIDGRTFIAEALDISQGGVKVRSKAPITVPAAAIVSLKGLPPTPGAVRWSSGELHGIAFSQCLPLKSLVEWIRSQRSATCAREVA